jgi:hypothetical protein
MTQTGSPYNNAVCRKSNGILKHQLALNQVFKNYTAAATAVCKAIDAYNCLRPHMSASNLHLSGTFINATINKKMEKYKKYNETIKR